MPVNEALVAFARTAVEAQNPGQWVQGTTFEGTPQGRVTRFWARITNLAALVAAWDANRQADGPQHQADGRGHQDQAGGGAQP